jgi:hypothetical protein
MKIKYLCIAALSLLMVIQAACQRPSATGPTSTGNNNNGGGGGGAVTITVSTGSSGSSATGYIYTSSSGSNGTGGLLSLTAHVGNVIILPGSSLHPLYFDNGSSTCIYMGAAVQETYTFPATGTYYFHCGNHATSCSAGNGACGSTNCSAMAGVITVS